ncbi:MAG TPA: ubiquinone biosynthesis protein UbiH, partial [Burkholderiaceae bacterium]|nr:ubiquinone biosynthesis protein UbiH [Burkholderiaceae bacterium]
LDGQDRQGRHRGRACRDGAADRHERARRPWRSLGDARTLREYARERAAPTLAMSGLVDGLWQLFSRDEAAFKELRNQGMSLVDHLPPLKRWLTRQALQG